MPISQQQHAMYQVMYACHVVRREHNGPGPAQRQISRRKAIEEQQCWFVGTRRRWYRGQRGGQAAMHGEQRADGAGIRTARAGDALEQRGLARPTGANDCDALTQLDVERASTQHPDPCRAAAYACRIALPEILDAEGEGHGEQWVTSASPPSSNALRANQSTRQRGRVWWNDAMASARMAGPNRTVSVVGRPVSRRTVSTTRCAASSSRS